MRIGILGGTFDPIHFGHIRPAQEVLAQLSLDEVWLMPNHIPPHKQGPQVSTKQRLAMVKQVCLAMPEFTLCDIEAMRNRPSYTSITLAQLKALYPQHQFFFIMGMDSFKSLHSWHDWQSLFNFVHIVVCQRQGWELSENESIYTTFKQRQCLPNACTKDHGNIIPITVTPQPYSSTEIRHKLGNGIMPLVDMPELVSQFIVDQQLYHYSK